MKVAALGVVVLLFSGCGGGAVPSELSTPRVLIAIQQPEKRLRYRDDRLNLVKHIIPVQGDRFLVVGDGRLCTVQPSGVPATCVDWPIELWELDVLVDNSGAPTTFVGSGGWGKPSVAVLDLKGALKWKFDGGFDLMDDAFVVESADRGVVVVGNRTFDLATGAVLDVPCGCGAVGSADFDQDGRRDLLQVRENLLRLVNGDGQELHRVQLDLGSWREPLVVRGTEPFVVLSSSEELAIYDGELKERRRFRTPGAQLPLHAAAASFFGPGLDGPFAVLVKGRGGWHRTILYVYSEGGDLVYQEILGDDYESIMPYTLADGALAFLVGGRGEVWSYHFAR